ncbi:MAG: galactokinase [Mycobacteriales bacterium]
MPTATWTAPGRLNLIGEHTDYNDGFVLPIALPYRTTATVTPRGDGLLRVRSAQRPDEAVEVPVADLRPGRLDGWPAYVAGVVWALREAGHPVGGGADVAVDGQVPEGAGLSSSAALECSVAAALAEVLGLALPSMTLARLAQRAENEFVGVPTGAMDQLAAMLCTAGAALFVDIRGDGDGPLAEQVPLDLAAAGLAILVIDTRSPHRLVDGEYADRRRACEAAAAALGVPALRDVELADLDAALARLTDEVQRRRARHVVTENGRVLRAVSLLRAGQMADLGPLLTASHASLRDDFEVTVPQLDTAVEAALSAGALGARMTGGGFGGCVLALLPAGDAAGSALRAAVDAAYASAGFTPPAYFVAVPSAGAQPAGA